MGVLRYRRGRYSVFPSVPCTFGADCVDEVSLFACKVQHRQRRFPWATLRWVLAHCACICILVCTMRRATWRADIFAGGLTSHAPSAWLRGRHLLVALWAAGPAQRSGNGRCEQNIVRALAALDRQLGCGCRSGVLAHARASMRPLIVGIAAQGCRGSLSAGGANALSSFSAPKGAFIGSSLAFVFVRVPRFLLNDLPLLLNHAETVDASFRPSGLCSFLETNAFKKERLPLNTRRSHCPPTLNTIAYSCDLACASGNRLRARSTMLPLVFPSPCRVATSCHDVRGAIMRHTRFPFVAVGDWHERPLMKCGLLSFRNAVWNR